MPSHRAHTFINRTLFGKSYWRLHKHIDMPFLFMGRRHRVLFHDAITPVAMAQKLYPSDPRAEEAAMVHVQIDGLCSSDPFFKKQLEFFAELDARERRRVRKQRSRKPKLKSRKNAAPLDELEKFNAFLEKLAEVRRLSRLIRS